MYKIFCMPTSRCFKGFTILFGIWAVASLLLAVMIPPIVRNHGIVDPHPTAEEWSLIEVRITKLLWGGYMLAAIFAGFSVISLFVCLGLRKKEGTDEQDDDDED